MQINKNLEGLATCDPQVKMNFGTLSVKFQEAHDLCQKYSHGTWGFFWLPTIKRGPNLKCDLLLCSPTNVCSIDFISRANQKFVFFPTLLRVSLCLKNTQSETFSHLWLALPCLAKMKLLILAYLLPVFGFSSDIKGKVF